MDSHPSAVEKSASSKAEPCESVLPGGVDIRWLLPVVLGFLATLAYLAWQSRLFVASQLPWHERSVAFLFLLCAGYLLIHGLGFLRDVLRGLLPAVDAGNPLLHRPPSVAVLVLGCGERVDCLEQTLNSCRDLEYPNKQIYLLDDVRCNLEAMQTPEMTAYRREVEEMCKRLDVCLFRGNRNTGKAGILNDFLDFMAGRGDPGAVLLGAPSGASRPPAPEYLAIFEAGMILQPDVLGARVEQMQRSQRLASTQFLEDYTNLAASRVARADALHEAVFRRVIGEGHSKRAGMICRGVNAFFRRAALASVGGFDDGRLTADFAISSKFSRRGWVSVFVNRTGVACKGPEGLGSYFAQQFHRTLGTTGILCNSLRQLFRFPPGLGWFKTAAQALSATRCFFGWVFLVICLMPVLFIFLGSSGLLAAPEILLGVLILYAGLGLSVFFLGSQEPRCRPGDLFAGIVLPAVAFPAYYRATFAAITGRRVGSGEAQPAGSVPLSALWPQTVLLLMSFAAVVWAANRWWFTHEDGIVLFLNSLWCLCNVVVLSVAYYLNQPGES